MTYQDAVNLAAKTGADANKLFVTVSQLERMNGTFETIAKIERGEFSIVDGWFRLDDRSDPGRNQVNDLYQSA